MGGVRGQVWAELTPKTGKPPKGLPAGVTTTPLPPASGRIAGVEPANLSESYRVRPAGTGAVDTAATEAPVPLCPCHHVPTRWKADRFASNGGSWICVVKHLERQRRYDRSDKGRARRKRHNATENVHVRKWLYDMTRIRAY